jgi:hypothetical protein
MARPEAIVEAVHSLVRLRRAERDAGPKVRADLSAGLEYIESSIGPTIRPAVAARLLGVSQPSLSRWLDEGEIASVLTPEGRRELPTSEVVELLEEIEQLGASDTSRPLAAVLKARRLAADELVDIDRLLPRAARTHRTAELQALAYHRLVAERLDDSLVQEARRRLKRWRAAGRIDPRWAEEWERLLELPPDRIGDVISGDDGRARELRQSSPFSGVLSEHERKALLDAVERRAG